MSKEGYVININSKTILILRFNPVLTQMLLRLKLTPCLWFGLVCAVLCADVEEEEESELDSQLNGFYLKALEGFLMVLSEDGDIVYLSENVSKCMGLSQVSRCP